MVYLMKPGSERNGPLLEHMYRDRKRVFVDRLGWNVPTVGEFERDAFDAGDARYLIVTDSDRRHLGSVRLLPTHRPHLLDTHFPMLCSGAIPRGLHIMEISRLCFSPECRVKELRTVRDRLTTALVQFGLLSGITSYTLVTGMSILSGILAQGWRCRPLGMPARHASELLGALQITIESETISRLRAAGTYANGELSVAPSPLAFAA